MWFYETLAVLFVPQLFTTAAPVLPKRRSQPFSQLVVFGDQLSDNGNGSFAHGLDPDNIYGFHTWTDGPVAVQYLADLLKVPLLDFAWGGSFGGGLAGPTVDNDYTPAKDTYQGAPVPSTKQQIFDNYTANGAPSNIQEALQLIWIGQNDIKKHTNWYANPPSKITPNAKANVAFYQEFTSRLLPQVEHLIESGAPAVVVMNIYPIHTAPETTYFFCHGNQECAQNWGKVVEAANQKLESSLAASKYAGQIIYYDVYSLMMNVMANKDTYGYTQPLNYYCDGNHSLPECKWTECTKYHPATTLNWNGARPFFWFNNGQPETTVHRLIAEDLKKTIRSHFRNK